MVCIPELLAAASRGSCSAAGSTDMKLCIPFLVIALLCGCAHESGVTTHQPTDGSGGVLSPKRTITGHGDVGQFIMQIAIKYGKKPPVAKRLPLISDHWSYTEYYGSSDIRIRLSPEKYKNVKLYLDQFFGPANFSREGKDSIYTYGLTKPVNGGGIDTTVMNIDGQDTTEILICPPR